MNFGPLIFLAAFFALAGSWFGFVLTPQMQVGHLQQTNAVPSLETYPLARPGLASQGLDVYRANGCAYCHSQQVRQSGTVCDVLLTAAGTNQTAIVQAILTVRPDLSESAAKDLLGKLPQTVKQGLTREEADNVVKTLKVGGAKSEPWIVPVGADISRGWGKRRTVAVDYIFDTPVMLGSQRIGPDLANVGSRLPDPNWQLRHLYAPGSEVKDSAMPPFRYLFEKRRIEHTSSPDALVLTGAMAPEPGYEIVPKPEAKALVSYLLSLHAGETPLYEAPLTLAQAPAPAATNAPSQAPSVSTNTPPTNAPGK
jgi:cbb3-type cytochrome oxidase cytochrome c subunit